MNNGGIKHEPSYGILVNTCDSFADCWVPFFKLLTEYWPDCSGRMYLNTETADFFYQGLDIVALKVGYGEDGRPLTWSECLLRALDRIEENVVLYTQEDYFLRAPVQNGWVERYVRLMQTDESVHCIHLTDQAVMAASPSGYPGLSRVKTRQRYLISCQSALWRKDVLKSYLRAHESAWQFEEFGSKRARRMRHNFYVVDPSWVRLNNFEIIPYVFTGVVRGRWKEEVVQLFDSHDIKIDYALRGFVKDAPEPAVSVKLRAYCKRFPVMLRSYFDLILLLAKRRETKGRG